jgi:6-pyruvoyltetrahydropterin/6-carboxytetrahydropterin synthase
MSDPPIQPRTGGDHRARLARVKDTPDSLAREPAKAPYAEPRYAARMEFRVRVERNTLKFAAAHMATFGGEMEALHGHNYAVTIEVVGTLTADAWVIDFSTLKSLGKAICDELDHKFLLQARSPLIEIKEGATNWKLRHSDRGFVFPKTDVLPLPLDNTTAERIAEYFVERLRDDLRRHGAANITSVTVGIEEAPGQSGWATQAL